VDPLAPRRSERLAVELPAGVSAEGVGLERMPSELARRMFVELHETASYRIAPGAGRKGAFSQSVSEDQSVLRRLGAWYKKGHFTGGHTHHGRATRVEVSDSEAVIEFEAPFDNFCLPTGELTLSVAGKEVGRAQVIVEKSSPMGSHGRGLIVRLAFRLEEGLPCPAGEHFVLHWEASKDLRFELSVPIPTDAGRDIPTP